MENVYVERLGKMAFDLQCVEIAGEVLDDPDFAVWTGSSKPHKHHYGKGLLAEHTCEVAEIALANNAYFEKTGKGVDKTKLFLACLYHDVGKMWDYEPLDPDLVDPEMKHWKDTRHRFRIHHISKSGLVWCRAAAKYGWSEADTEEVWHCVLSHHNLKEWNSPVQPKTRMAWLLHLADGMSARMDDCVKRDD